MLSSGYASTISGYNPAGSGWLRLLAPAVRAHLRNNVANSAGVAAQHNTLGAHKPTTVLHTVKEVSGGDTGCNVS